MSRQTPEDLSEFIRTVLRRSNPLLFVGAGVGRRIGLPDWHGFIEHLAHICDRYEPESASLIRARLSKRQLLPAATVYKSCQSIPVGERLRLMAEPFAFQKVTDENIEKLRPLVGLNFTGIVTTNYDSSLHTVATMERRGFPLPVELGDVSLKGAALLDEFFVGRIHGRADQPQGMVVDTADYDLLRENADYLEFVLEILKSRSCLFVGFSFVDPSIDHILALYQERFGPQFRALHAALIPKGADELANRLRDVNIEALIYEPEDSHADLWRSIRLAYDAEKTDARRAKPAIVTASAASDLPGFFGPVIIGERRSPDSPLYSRTGS